MCKRNIINNKNNLLPQLIFFYFFQTLDTMFSKKYVNSKLGAWKLFLSLLDIQYSVSYSIFWLRTVFWTFQKKMQMQKNMLATFFEAIKTTVFVKLFFSIFGSLYKNLNIQMHILGCFCEPKMTLHQPIIIITPST